MRANNNANAVFFTAIQILQVLSYRNYAALPA
jgi:hypothetical protein